MCYYDVLLWGLLALDHCHWYWYSGDGDFQSQMRIGKKNRASSPSIAPCVQLLVRDTDTEGE